MPIPKTRRLIQFSLAVFVWCAACTRDEQSSEGGGVDTIAHAPDIGPAQTIRHVHQLRLRGRIEQLESFLIPQQREPVVELIQSVDRLIAANSVLQLAVTEHLGPASARALDRSNVANLIGVFSRDVEVITEEVSLDRAVVTIQVNRRVPLNEIVMVRDGNRWLIQTDPPIPGVAEDLRHLADALERMARLVSDSPMTLAQARRELDTQTGAIGRRLLATIERQSMSSSVQKSSTTDTSRTRAEP